jgi:diguanylate cyclase (GGDEF)-like protein
MRLCIFAVADQIELKNKSEAIFRKLNHTVEFLTSDKLQASLKESRRDSRRIVFLLWSRLDDDKKDLISRILQTEKHVSIILYVLPEELKSDVYSCVKNVDYLDVLPVTYGSVTVAIDTIKRKIQIDCDISNGENQLKYLKTAHQVFVSAGRFMASSLLVENVLTGIMEAVGSLLRAEAWSVALQDEHTDDLVFRAARGIAQENITGAKVPCDRSIIGWVFKHGKPLIVPDTSKDQRHFKAFDKSSGFTSKSILCMPLKTKDKTLGAIEFINKVGSQFASQDIDRIQVILDLAAITLENATMFETLNVLVERDELTGLFNQDSLVKRLEKLIESAGANKCVFGYIFLDLDYLKRVNDRYGHLSGRAVLREVGQLLDEILDEGALKGRYGGDEFWVIIPGADEAVTMQIAEHIRTSIENKVFLTQQGLNIRLTASLGVVIFPKHADTFDKMAYLADKALFMAKNKNRNNVVCAMDVIQSESL